MKLIGSGTWWGTLIALVTAASAVTATRDAKSQIPNYPNIVAVCASCHGTDGKGRDVETPNLAGQSGIYLRQQLMAFRNGTRRHPPMKGVARDLTDSEIDAAVSYYAILPPP
jgi:cytochrome c553